MSKRMVTYSVSDDDKIASIDGHALGNVDGNKSISRRMITYKLDDTGKITSIDGHELSGGGGGYEIKPLTVTENGVYDVAGEAYKPVRVNVPQTAQSGTLKAVLDATKSTHYLFANYTGTSVDGLITRSDTSNVRDMSSMFYHADNLITILELDTHNATNLSYMFNECRGLTSVPELDTSHATNMRNMFTNCRALTTIPPLNASQSTDMYGMVSSCANLTSIGLYGFTRSIDISSTALGHDAIVAFLNQAGTAYDSSQKITMGSSKLALLSDEEKAIATNKGWKLA